jgi:pectate lyase
MPDMSGTNNKHSNRPGIIRNQAGYEDLQEHGYMNKRYIATILVFALGAVSEAATAVPAFPGAEGFGANTIGGRGGRIIKVTNLNDSGTGSLRAAISATGPRIVVFDVSGIINLSSTLTISNPNITIAGQTSPGGILVTGYMTLVETSQVIIRHMRFRVGSHRIAQGADPETLDSLDIWGPQSGTSFNENIIIDHCSVGWGVDENFSTAYRLRNVTISHNLVHEGLMNAGHPKGQHSKGLFVWGKYSPNMTVSLHHNFLAHNYDRNPLINTGDGSLLVDAVNNVTYNFFGGYAMGTQDNGQKVNWVHNYSKGGPSSNAQYYEIFHEAGAGTPVPLLYVKGNIGGSRKTQTGSDWTVASSWQFSLANAGWGSATPWPVAQVTATTMTAAYASQVVAEAGATRPFRDSVDQKMASDFANGSGAYRQNVSYPADFPIYQNLAAPIDSDGDGMPDAWESAHGLNSSADDSAADRNSDGYTNIEEYLNSLANDVEVVRPKAPTITVQ